MNNFVRTRVDKLVSSHSTGAISTQEFIDAFILNAVRLDEAKQYVHLLQLLPQPLALAVRQRLDEIRSNAFRWEPFLIGDGLDADGLERLSVQLRVMYNAIETLHA